MGLPGAARIGETVTKLTDRNTETLAVLDNFDIVDSFAANSRITRRF